MKFYSHLYTCATLCLYATTQAQLIPFFADPSKSIVNSNSDQEIPDSKQVAQQQPLDPHLSPETSPLMSSQQQLHPTTSDDKLFLTDVLPNQRQINIFAGFTRDIASISARLNSASQNTTLLAPLNTAISDLPRKPWEDPRDYAEVGDSAYAKGQEGEDRAHRNLRRFTEAHVVPASPWEEGVRVKTLGGGEVWWESRKKEQGIQGGGNGVVVMPGGIEVERVASRVANGEVWILKGVMNYAA